MKSISNNQFIETGDLKDLRPLTKELELPDEITTDQVPIVLENIKELKQIIKVIKVQKKKAEQPSEEARKKADDMLTEARSSKTLAGKPFQNAAVWCAGQEVGLRKLLTDLRSKQDRARQEELARIAKLEAEQARLEEEAKQAKIKARKSDSDADKAIAENLKESNTKITQDISNIVSSITETAEIPVMKRVEFKVLDITKVPDMYVKCLPDKVAIMAAIVKQFPFIKNLSLEVEPDVVPIEFMYDDPIDKEILRTLRAGKDIPGIEKVIIESTLVR